MIELRHDQLTFSFPNVHPEATLSVNFQRTLRIPDDGHDYPMAVKVATGKLNAITGEDWTGGIHRDPQD